jgi:hypothetical protein
MKPESPSGLSIISEVSESSTPRNSTDINLPSSDPNLNPFLTNNRLKPLIIETEIT